jgi:hypothetical protein
MGVSASWLCALLATRAQPLLYGASQLHMHASAILQLLRLIDETVRQPSIKA